MHIVYVTIEYIDPVSFKIIDGGLANYLVKITKELNENGNIIDVIVISDKNLSINWNNINVHFIQIRAYKKNIIDRLFSPLLKKKLISRRIQYKYKQINNFITKIDKSKKIDIIQYASCLSLGLFPHKDIPSCLRISSYEKLFQESYGEYDLESISNDCAQFKKSRFIFGPSKHIASIIEKDLGLKTKIGIIESPKSDVSKEFDYYSLDQLMKIIGNNKYFLFFGTIGELKGCGTIARCIYRILSSYKEIFFVMVGKVAIKSNGVNYKQEILKASKEFSDRIIHFDSLPHERLFPIIKKSSFIVMPSLTENFSNACVEAMSLGKIVIGTEDNFSQLICDGENGFLSISDNPDSLYNAINKVMNLSDDEKKSISDNAIIRTNSLSVGKIAKQLISYYREVINQW